MNKINVTGLWAGLLLLTACQPSTKTATDMPVSSTVAADSSQTPRIAPAPEWARNATIYEVNTRQFSDDGNFKAVEAQLPRLKELGADIIWLMPIYPISQTNKKGTLGSPYAVADYKAVNPAYGTLADFKALVLRAHKLGLRVILDWVPNHTGHDHIWVKQHPDWYTRVKGKLTTPLDEKGKPTDWTDVVDLNYDNTEMRAAMIDALQYWVRECDVDGYRCDVAGLVPDDFWADVRPALDKIKPVFMLAEWEDDPKQFDVCFNMNYGWSLHKLLKEVAKGTRPATAIDSLLTRNRERFPPGYYQMQFTQNHDENTWNGTLTESFGAGADACTALAYTVDGMPLLYNGMEANLSKRLKFFEKDPIYWGNYGKTDFYKALLTLKHRNKALWNGLAGGKPVKISTGNDQFVYAFHRQKETDHIAVVINLSDQPHTIRLSGGGFEGIYTDVFTRQPVELKSEMILTLRPWEYRVMTN